MLINGKDIILQRLRNKIKLSKYRKIDHETTHVFDLFAKKYEIYREGNNKLIFHIIKKSDINKKSNEKYVNLLKIPKNLMVKGEFTKETIDQYVNKYDEKTNRFYDKLCCFREMQKEFIQEKNINPIFMVDYIIGGKLSNGEIFYAPFAFQNVEINIKHNNREVEFIRKNDQIFANIPFIASLGNELNIPIENELENLNDNNDARNANMKILAIYKKLKIELDPNSFLDNKNYEELKISYENKSSKIDENVAEHEAKHLVCVLHYNKHLVDSININNDKDILGSVEFLDDGNCEKKLVSLIAPYLREINSLHDVITKQNLQPNNSDFDEIMECIETLSENNNTEKEEIFRSCQYEAQCLLRKYQKKIEQFKCLLMKYKILDHEEIMQQWENDELIEISRKLDEVKFIKNNFFVKHVKSIMYCPELFEQGIYNDVKYIFKTSFIENFLSQTNKQTNKQDCLRFYCRF